MNNQGRLLVISGFSGAGKGTVVKAIMESHDDYALSVSATTRAPRAGEQEGVSYFYKTEAEFKRMIADGELLEYANYVGNYYGTPRAYVEDRLKDGYNVILEIESVGAFNVKKMFPEAVLIYITPPSADELESRLRGRGTEEESVIRARLQKASSESGGVERYDYIVINDTVDKCVSDIDGIAKNEPAVTDRCLVGNNLELINKVRHELEKYSKGE